jgi:hypothetical protein
MRYIALIAILLTSASGQVQAPNVAYDSMPAGSNLTDPESAALTSSLKWSPATAQVKLGGSTRIQLQDGSGRVLASVRLSWTSLDSSRIAGFTLVLENSSRCLFTSSAELKTPDDETVVTSKDWQSWTSQKHPAPGRANELSTGIVLAKASAVLELRPADPRSAGTLSQCRTAQISPAKSPFDGAWIITTPGGPRPLEATFEVDGTKLRGAMKLGTGALVPISSGKVEGNRISFSFPGGNKRALFLSGSLNGDVIEMELALGPNEYGSPFSAKRK